MEFSPRRRRERLAKTAANLLIDASNTFPGSVQCQAILITQEAKIEPRKLGKALLKSDKQKARIKTAAETAHGHARAKKAEDITAIPYSVTEELVYGIILSNFNYASKYRNVPKEQLEEILDHYGKLDEASLKSKVDVYVQGHRNLRYRSMDKNIAF